MNTIYVDADKLRKMYHEMTVGDIAEKYGVSKPTVYRMLNDAGIERKGTKKVVVIGGVA